MFEKIEQKSVFQEILRQIKTQIQSGAWKAGDKIPSERVLSEQMQVSRPAVREAVRALQMLGIVRCVQGDANYLASDFSNSLVEPFSILFFLSGGVAMQAQQLRSALEIETAYLAAQRCTREDAEQLQAIVRQLDSETDERARAELDRTLHFLIADISANPLILSVLNGASSLIESIITGIRIAVMNEPSAIHQIDAQHRAIVEAITQNNPEMAREQMKVHMELISSFVLSMQEAGTFINS
jgi:GntR family transcriptional repressor for pyruvate dehydrogenase complex